MKRETRKLPENKQTNNPNPKLYTRYYIVINPKEGNWFQNFTVLWLSGEKKTPKPSGFCDWLVYKAFIFDIEIFEED